MRKIPPPTGLTLTALRRNRGLTEPELAAKVELSDEMVSRYESGASQLQRKKLLRFAEAMGYDEAEVDLALSGIEGAVAAPEAPLSPADLAVDERRRLRVASLRAGLAVAGQLEGEMASRVRRQRVKKERRRAARLWARLKKLTAEKRRSTVEENREFHTWALAERLCDESVQAAAHRVDLAVELAGLALLVAELAPGEPAWRSRLLGYCWAFVANARRVASDLPGAEEAFALAWRLWRAGAAPPELLPEWRLLDLEASLLRAGRRFAESLERIGQALALAPRQAWGRILLNKSAVFDQMEEPESAIMALKEAFSLVDDRSEPRQIFGLCFNLIASLCRLERFEEAQPLLPEVRERAVSLRNELDLVRVLWLESSVSAGLGRFEEALAAMEQVRQDLHFRKLSYDEGLVSLEIAALYLKQGRNTEVRRLAEEMLETFERQRVHREALAALALFWEAARNEAVTVELLRRLIDFLHRARRDPGLRFEG